MKHGPAINCHSIAEVSCFAECLGGAHTLQTLTHMILDVECAECLLTIIKDLNWSDISKGNGDSLG